MSKLRLNLDDLAVDTFHPATRDGAWKGTVRAHGAETFKTLCASLLASNHTCCPCRRWPDAGRPAPAGRAHPSPPTIGRLMRKLKLRMDELAVESFPTSNADGGMGTVQGQEIPTPPYFTCKPCLLTKPTDCPCTP